MANKLLIPPGLVKYVNDLPNNADREGALIQWLLMLFFEPEWFDENIQPKGKKTSFIRLARDLSNEAIISVRLNTLATALLNLQLRAVPGFDSFLALCRSDMTEGRFAEVNLAFHMLRCGVRFGFNKKSATNDYDFDMRTSLGYAVAVEAKCRVLGIKFRRDDMIDTLKKAVRRQLPRDKAAALFVQVPPEWYARNSEMDAVVNDIFRRYGHIVSIVFYVQQAISMGSYSEIFITHQEISNPRHEFKGVYKIFRRHMTRGTFISIKELIEMCRHNGRKKADTGLIR